MYLLVTISLATLVCEVAVEHCNSYNPHQSGKFNLHPGFSPITEQGSLLVLVWSINMWRGRKCHALNRVENLLTVTQLLLTISTDTHTFNCAKMMCRDSK